MKEDSWRIKICNRISAVDDFPNEKIIDIYLNDGVDFLSKLLALWFSFYFFLS